MNTLYYLILLILSTTEISWPKFRHDLQNTGYTTAQAPDSLYLNWKSSPLFDVVSSPAIDDSMFFLEPSVHQDGWFASINIPER